VRPGRGDRQSPFVRAGDTSVTSGLSLGNDRQILRQILRVGD
jgi:hypothetical protein